MHAQVYSEETQTRPLSFDFALSLTSNEFVFTHDFIKIALSTALLLSNTL